MVLKVDKVMRIQTEESAVCNRSRQTFALFAFKDDKLFRTDRHDDLFAASGADEARPAREAGIIRTDAGEAGRELAAWLVENKLV